MILTGRDQNVLEATAAELGAEAVVCDATDTDAIAVLAERVGGVDVLVNNAGANTDLGDGSDVGLHNLRTSWLQQLETNLLSAVLTTAALAPGMRTGGAVVSLGSIGAERGGGSYGAAKAALAAWNAFLSASLGPRDITCNVVSSGYVENTGFFGAGPSPQRREALVAATHVRRPGTVEDVAGTIHFLAGPDARHITGQTVHLNGGAFTTR